MPTRPGWSKSKSLPSDPERIAGNRPIRSSTGGEHIGINDSIWRKSLAHGTVIVDLEPRTVLGVLGDRDVVTCTEWLKNYPEVEVISRDRNGFMLRLPVSQSLQADADQDASVRNVTVIFINSVLMLGQ